MNIIIINGPNLNMLGYRNHKNYGSKTLEQINELIITNFPKVDFEFYQSNHEGDIIDKIQEVKYREENYCGLIINPGGYTHTSVAIGDALEYLEIPIIEVHLSNVTKREEFRQLSYVTKHAITNYCGEKEVSYLKAIKHLIELQ